jgi:hypothetical protein
VSKEGKLFDPVVPKEKLDSHFADIRAATTSIAARAMLEDVFESFEDPDGNFKEQFQTTGFDSRFFELYLYAYFNRSGFSVDRSHPYPDFMVERDGTKACIEATTVNPSTSGVIAKYGKKIEGLSQEELRAYAQEELPLRFGSALYSKLKKEYWKKPHCQGLPLVFAIQAFHDKGSLHFSDSALAEYAFATRQTAGWGPDGDLVLTNATVESHTLGEKTMPSGFFDLPGSEHVSAIMFSNSGTHAKFSRMGYQSGFGNDVLKIKRIGRVFNVLPDAMDATLFEYDMDDPNIVENWGQGLTVLHNPKALVPLPDGFFPHTKEQMLMGGHVLTSPEGWHPFNSDTIVMDMGEMKKHKITRFLLGHGPRGVAAVPRDYFWSFDPVAEVDGKEDGWFADDSESFLGLVVKKTADWEAMVFARDYHFRFFRIARAGGLSSRLEAVDQLQHKMLQLQASPRRLFDEPVG